MLCYRNLFSSPFATTPKGFEPSRAEHNGLAVHRLNHSATVSRWHKWRLRDKITLYTFSKLVLSVFFLSVSLSLPPCPIPGHYIVCSILWRNVRGGGSCDERLKHSPYPSIDLSKSQQLTLNHTYITHLQSSPLMKLCIVVYLHGRQAARQVARIVWSSAARFWAKKAGQCRWAPQG